MIEALKDHGPVLDKQVRERAVYASAITVGKTGPESSETKQAAEAGAEIDALWQAVKKLSGAKPAKAGARP